MQSTKNEEQMEDPMVNTILIVELHMTNESWIIIAKVRDLGSKNLKMSYHCIDWINKSIRSIIRGIPTNIKFGYKVNIKIGAFNNCIATVSRRVDTISK